MPQTRIHESHADRQAAYRQRRQIELAAHLESKGLPPVAAGKTKSPGPARWKAAMAFVEAQMMRVEAEMEAYHDERTERWQQSDRGEEFQQKLDDLRVALDLVTEWIA